MVSRYNPYVLFIAVHIGRAYLQARMESGQRCSFFYKIDSKCNYISRRRIFSWVLEARNKAREAGKEIHVLARALCAERNTRLAFRRKTRRRAGGMITRPTRKSFAKITEIRASKGEREGKRERDRRCARGGRTQCLFADVALAYLRTRRSDSSSPHCFVKWNFYLI